MLQVVAFCHIFYFQAKKSSCIRNGFLTHTGTVLILLLLHGASNSLHHCHGSSEVSNFHRNTTKLQNVAWQCSIRKPDYLPLTSGSSPVFHIMKHDCSLKHCSARRAPNWGIYRSGDGYWERWMRLAALFVCNNWHLQVHSTVNVTKCMYLLSAF